MVKGIGVPAVRETEVFTSLPPPPPPAEGTEVKLSEEPPAPAPVVRTVAVTVDTGV